MSTMETIKVHRMPDGTEYRACLDRDTEPQEPYDDGAWPILRVEYKHYDYVATAFNKQAVPYVDKFNELFERLRGLRNWERFAKIFLGATAVHEYGFNRGTDYSYIAFDAKEWRESMEMDTPEGIAKFAEEDPLTEIKAWIEGDVWGYIIQSRWNPDEELEDDEDWGDVDSCWGFYGRKWGEEAADGALTAEINSHEYVHRYPEHEKIDPHQKEINAIMDFLYAMEDTELVRTRPDGVRVTVTSVNYQVMVFEHFGIDYNEIEKERELMLQRLREKAQEATDK